MKTKSPHQIEDAGARYMPTPEEIAAACAAIRAGWSDTTLQSRIVDGDKVKYADVARVSSGCHRRKGGSRITLVRT